MIRILNKYRDMIPSDAINAMRGGPLGLGNKFEIGRDGTRDEVCDKHLAWAREEVVRNPAFRDKVKALRGRTVFCCCKPRRCHVDNLALLCDELHAADGEC